MDQKSPNLPDSPISTFEPPPEMDMWETPFDRWARLADILLGNLPPATDKPNSRKRFTN